MIHQPWSPDGVHPQINLSPELLVLCLVHPDLFIMYYCLLFFFPKNSFLSLAPLIDKCHTSVFNTLIFMKGHWAKQEVSPFKLT